MTPLRFAKSVFQASWGALPRSVRIGLLPHILHGISDTDKLRFNLPTMHGLLRHLATSGFQPKTIIDIGAHVGEWGRLALSTFPSSHILMIDGNPAMEGHLASTSRELGSQAAYRLLVLGSEAKSEVTFYIVGNMDAGSGVLPELTTFKKGRMTLPMGTLDDLVTDSSLRRFSDAPLLMKLDVQGSELDVLRGARKALHSAEVVILETSFLPYNEGGASFAEVVAFMARAGFAVYDFCDQFRRQTDNALVQTDVAFARVDSDLRRPRRFWVKEP